MFEGGGNLAYLLLRSIITTSLFLDHVFFFSCLFSVHFYWGSATSKVFR